VDKVELEL